MIKYGTLAVAIALSAGCLSAQAQSSTPHRIFELNPDVRSSALGGTNLVTQSSNYIYTNPTKVFNAEKALSISLSGEYLPKFDKMNREKFGTFGFSYRIHDRHALMIGARFVSGLTLTKHNSAGEEMDEELRPAQATFDLSYATKLTDDLSIFTTASMLRSTTGRSTQSYFYGLGASYQYELSSRSGRTTLLEATAAAYNLGEDVPYTKGLRYQLPSTVSLALGATTSLGKDYSLGLKMQGNYLTAYKEMQFGAGLEYSYRGALSVMAGYRRVYDGVSFLSLGISSQTGGVQLDVAYNIGIGPYTKGSLSTGVSFQF